MRPREARLAWAPGEVQMDNIRKIRHGLMLACLAGVLMAKSVTAADGAAPLRVPISEAVRQMTLPHEATPYGVPDSYSWYARPTIEAGNVPPAGFRAITAWGQILRASGTAAVPMEVLLRNLRTYVLLDTGKLEMIQSSSSMEGAQFRTDYQGNLSTEADMGSDEEGNTRVATNPLAAFHFWPASGKVKFEPRRVRGIVVTLEARIRPKHAQPVADTSRKLVLSVGADYWLATDSKWDNYRTNIGVGMGRFRYLSTEWQCFTMTTVSGSDLLALSAQVSC